MMELKMLKPWNSSLVPQAKQGKNPLPSKGNTAALSRIWPISEESPVQISREDVSW